MITLLPLAGASSRFSVEGYDKPKFLLPMPDYRTLLEWILTTLSPTDLITVARKEHMQELTNVIIMAKLEKSFKWRGVWVEKLTFSPLDTVLKARKLLHGSKDELAISYGDCFLYPSAREFFDLTRANAAHEAGLVTLESESDRFTRVPGFENLCAGGVFWFRRAHEFLRHAEQVYKQSAASGVPSVVYSFRHWATYTEPGAYHDLGVPADYRAFLAEGARG